MSLLFQRVGGGRGVLKDRGGDVLLLVCCY